MILKTDKHELFLYERSMHYSQIKQFNSFLPTIKYHLSVKNCTNLLINGSNYLVDEFINWSEHKFISFLESTG